jgi:isochorismate synthase
LTATALIKLTEQEAFETSLKIAQSQNLGFAAWQLPLSSNRHISIGDVTMQKQDRLNDQGFIFHPYDDKEPGHFIRSKLSFDIEDEVLSIGKSEGQLLETFENHSSENNSYHINASPVALEIDKTDFLKYVSQSVDAIKSGSFQKVVPARSKQVCLTRDFDLYANYKQLCEAYPNAFVSVVSIPEVGTWVGATPEVLINVDQELFQTVSLAGTQKYDPSLSLSEVAWTQKEIEEQAMVSRYIINCFKKIRLREFQEAGPKTVVAGNLIHLKTSFSVDIKATNSPELGNVMLDLLHPTSAVCGMPKASAADFIKNHENGNREFYSGYLGPVNNKKETNLFVNLRCMQLLNDSAILYAGAGVTEDSVPEKEWLETELKMNTLLNIIKL